jgi:RNA ligase (TIGR02306 family)
VRRKELQSQRKRRVVYNPDGTPVMEKVMKPVRDERGRFVIGDNGQPKEELVEQEQEWFYEVTKRSQFWEALDTPGVRGILVDLCNGQHNVVIFAELYGSGVQDMAYGLERGNWAIRVFDITVNGKYLDHDAKADICERACVPMVPVLYRGPFSRAKVDEYVGGPTTICNASKIVGFKEREGIVITTTKEHTVTTEAKFFDRAAVKAINFAYLERGGDATEHH